MKTVQVRHAALAFVKMIVIVFTIVFCCILLEPERNTKKSPGFSDCDSGFTYVQHQPLTRSFIVTPPQLFPGACVLLPSTFDLVTTIAYRSKSVYVTFSVRRFLFLVPTINAP